MGNHHRDGPWAHVDDARLDTEAPVTAPGAARRPLSARTIRARRLRRLLRDFYFVIDDAARDLRRHGALEVHTAVKVIDAHDSVRIQELDDVMFKNDPEDR